MDGFDNITAIPGSRHPVLIPVSQFDTSSSSSHTPTPPSANSSNGSFTVPRNRRKPTKVYKSPTANEPAEWEGLTVSVPRKRGTPPYEKPPPRQLSSDCARSSPPISIPDRRAAAQRKVPLLPLYHPLGALAQSLPELDPGNFGLPGSLNIEDAEDPREGDATRRSASRTQRPGQKTREREAGEDDAQSPGTPNGAGKPGADAPARNPSPRKRRGGGAKRKRKDAEDGDTSFPAPPAKRTRNPRGANLNAPAAPSPLISEAVAASDLVEDSVEGNAAEPEEAQEDAAPVPPKRSARTRKPRVRQPKRRDSSGSASTTTSVSVAVVAAAQPVAQPQKPADEPAAEVIPEPKPLVTAEPEKAAPVQVQSIVEVPKELEKVLEPHAAQELRPQEEPPAIIAAPVVPEHKEPPPKPSAPPALAKADPLPTPVKAVPLPVPAKAIPPPVPAKVIPPSAPPKADPLHAPPAPVRPPSPPPVPPPQKEEREEGELSDDA